MKRNGFSMIELVFVIVILGVLAAVAVPRFVTTRTDAQVAMIRSDIASVLKQVPAKVFAANLNVIPTQNADDGYKYDVSVCGNDIKNTQCSGWGDWMKKVTGLDDGRWYAFEKFLVPFGSNKMITCGIANKGRSLLEIDDRGYLILNVNNIDEKDTFCTALRNSYPSGTYREIALSTSNNVVW